MLLNAEGFDPNIKAWLQGRINYFFITLYKYVLVISIK